MNPNRASLLEAVASGMDLARACLRHGVTVAVGKRWVALAEAEREGLAEPRRSGSGRRAVGALLNAEQAEELWKLRLHTETDAMAVLLYTRRPDCPEAFRAMMNQPGRSRHVIPPSVRKLMHIAPEAAAAHRGPKALAEVLVTGRRDLTEVEPGDWWELDDMSINHPYYFELGPRVEGEEPGKLTKNGTSDRLAERQGLMVGRQGLYCCDQKSGYWLGSTLIGRAKDSYQAGDILRFLRQLMEEYGKPRRGLVLERGIWTARAIDGVKPADQEDAWKDEVKRTVAGIQDMGIEVVHAYTSRGKCFIEGAFKDLQKIMRGLYPDWCHIGKERGEMEREAKLIRSLQQGARTPAQAGVVHLEEARRRVVEAMRTHNELRREGEHQAGVPKALFEASLMARPPRHLTREDTGLLLPELLETTIRGMHVTKKQAGTRYRWIAPEVFATLGNDYPVLIRFDTERPDEGCAVYNNAAPSAHNNTAGHKRGAFLGWAEAEACGASDQRGRVRKTFRALYGSTLDSARLKVERKTTPHVVGHNRPTLTLTTPATIDAARLSELDQFEAEHA